MINKISMISIIIPVKDRENVIGRAIDSVLNQKIKYGFEIIVVDDASIDNTVHNIIEFKNKHKEISLIKNKVSMGGAVARNIGAKQAKGNYIAFLDSDDEWLEDHLQSKIELIIAHNVQGAFGAFNIIRNKKIKELDFAEFKGNDIFHYILLEGGDARTSTFVFQRDAFMKIMFDDNLGKHQDWDLAIRFDKKFNMVFDTEKKVNMYVDGENRMSNKNNYAASTYFLTKHKSYFTNQALYNFKLNICLNAYRTEGVSDNFKKLMDELKHIGENSDVIHKRNYKLLNNSFSRMLLPFVFYLQRIFR